MLADWAEATLVVRSDVYGGQVATGGGRIERRTFHDGLSRSRLVRHFAAGPDSGPEEVIGIHNASPDETCRWIAFDVDRHDDAIDAAANFGFARRILKRALRAGLDAVLLDTSGGRGGLHLWCVADRPIPLRAAFRLGRYLARGHEEFGLPGPVESFPKNDVLTYKRCGWWLRLPGRHHRRDEWARVWSPRDKRWLEGDAAVDRLLAVRGGPVDPSAIVPADFTGRPPRPARPASTVRERRDDDDDLAAARDALGFLGAEYRDARDRWIQVGMALKDLADPEAAFDLFDGWSCESPRYDYVVDREQWEGVKPADEVGGAAGGIGLGSLFRWAKEEGWPGRAAAGLYYPVDLGRRPGPIVEVVGLDAYEALEAAGVAAVGLPEDRPGLAGLSKLIGDDPRGVVVLGSREPHVDPTPLADELRSRLGRPVEAVLPPAPFADVASWAASRRPTSPWALVGM